MGNLLGIDGISPTQTVVAYKALIKFVLIAQEDEIVD